ncbi:MAG: DUF732 domain-containing protein, partial [Actinomycetia bacterium]|nr:DUF732 domain-containing protein [Actinomycetes bacterium]
MIGGEGIPFSAPDEAIALAKEVCEYVRVSGSRPTCRTGGCGDQRTREDDRSRLRAAPHRDAVYRSGRADDFTSAEHPC